MVENVKFNADGLVPVIAQCDETGDVLMMAWMNAESLDITLRTGRVTYYSRSRQELWEKGSTSGHTQTLVDATLDCDGDTILLTVRQVGAACHEGTRTCFTRKIPAKGGA
jgi:phosphoribosyl-AMP cyclohydrolase